MRNKYKFGEKELNAKLWSDARFSEWVKEQNKAIEEARSNARSWNETARKLIDEKKLKQRQRFKRSEDLELSKLFHKEYNIEK